MSIGAAPSFRVKIKTGALADIEIRLYDTYFRVYIFIELFLQNCTLTSAPGIFLFYFLLIVEPKAYCTQDKIKKLKGNMFGGIYFNNVIFTNTYMVAHKVFVIIQSKNIPLELTNLSTACRNVIYIQPHMPVFDRQIAVFQPEPMFYKLIVKNRELILLLFVCKHPRLILIIPKEYSNFSFPLIQQIESKIHNTFVLLKGVEVDFLPFDFFLYAKFFHQIA